MSRMDIIRRLRLGDLRKILRSRYGHTLPDDDAGREDLFEFLLPISLGVEPARKMKNTIETWARWMGADEAQQMIDQINRTPARERRVKARDLGERMRVSNEERERLRLQTIKPFDMTDEQLAEQRKAKDRARKRRTRRRTGSKPRDVYLANSLASRRPWETQGISRSTWERRRRKRRDASPSAVKLLNDRGHTCVTEKSAAPKALARRVRDRDRGRARIARGFAS